MSSESILRSSLLDIVFHNRNKEYGAYALRKEYPGRFYGALLFTFLVVAVFSGVSFFKFPQVTASSSPIIPQIDSVVLVEILPTPPPAVPRKSPAATIQGSAPLIVKDDLATDIPETKELENKVIGKITTEGTAIDEGPEPPSATAGTGQVKSEVETVPEVKEEILATADVMPEFPGGLDALRRFLSRNLRNPEENMLAGTNVRLVARFVVDKDGAISNIIFKEAAGKQFQEEVLRVLKKMPKWKPGVFKGRPASVYFVLPVVFQMNEE